MVALAAAYLTAAVLLGAAGAGKAVAPESAAAALARLRLPHRLWMVRILGIAELVVAVTAFVAGGPAPAIALALLYAGFVVVATYMVRSGPTTPCGCFGRSQAPVTISHIAVNILATAAGATAAIYSPETIDQLFSTRQWLLGPFIALVIASTYGLFALLTRTPHNHPRR